MTTRAAPALALAVTVLCLSSGCGPEAEPSGGPDEGATSASASASASDDGPAPALSMGFEGGTEVTGTDIASSAEIDVVELTDGDGSLALENGRDGEGQALRLPAFEQDFALLALTPQGDVDPFSPGTADFELAADIRVDADNEGSKADNGNNIVQRGLFSDPAQYKIQIERGVVSCRVAGTEGEVLVKADEPLPVETWSRVSCRRSGDTVALAVEDLDAGGARREWTGQGTIGEVQMASSTPLTVGGKVTSQMTVAAQSSDQFNGMIDNVTMRVEE